MTLSSKLVFCVEYVLILLEIIQFKTVGNIFGANTLGV